MGFTARRQHSVWWTSSQNNDLDNQVVAYIFQLICTHLGAYLYLRITMSATTRRDVFQGIADPTRRQILAHLTNQRLNLTAVAESFNITRQSVTKHVRILNQCGLVTIEKQGREMYCHARPEKLGEVTRWVEQMTAFWSESHDRLDEYLKTLQKNKTDKS
jgi:DNA-binding transcriptional ArsR family regulator